MGLNLGQFCPPGNIWQRLETCLVVTVVGLLLACVEGRQDAINAPQGIGQACDTGVSGPRWRNSNIEGRGSHFSWALLPAEKK